jgi:hypothetical protein
METPSSIAGNATICAGRCQPAVRPGKGRSLGGGREPSDVPLASCPPIPAEIIIIPVVSGWNRRPLILRRWSTNPAEPSQLHFEAPFKAALTIDGGSADANALYSDEDCQTKTDSLTITQGEIDDGVVNSAVFYLKAATVDASLTLNVDATAFGFAAVNATAEVVP